MHGVRASLREMPGGSEAEGLRSAANAPAEIARASKNGVPKIVTTAMRTSTVKNCLPMKPLASAILVMTNP